MGARFIILSTCQVCVKFLQWRVMLTIQKVNSLPSCCFNLRLIKQTSNKNDKNINLGIISRSTIKFSKLTLREMYGRQ